MRGHPTAAIVTIGDELVSGDVENGNATWLARRLEQLGFRVRLIASIPDDVDAIVETVRREAARMDIVIVAGGLGGTPDDVTREALAAAFDVPMEQHRELAARLREQFPHAPDHAAEWARQPAGARPLALARGGPGFVIENVYVFPGLPAMMEAMFDQVADELRRGSPPAIWRRTFRIRESEISDLLAEAGTRFPDVRIGSYPSFPAEGPLVEIVVKSSDEECLAAASEWLAEELEALTRS